MKFSAKHWIVLVLVLAIGLSLSACGGVVLPSVQENKEGDPFTIVTSFYPMYIFALNIALDVPGVTVENMTEPQTGCLHDYQLSTADMKSLESADAFIINGAGMESFMDVVTTQMKGLPVVDASRGMELLKAENGRDGNPHVWVGISGAIQQVKNITDQLASIDSAHTALYRSNADRYVFRLEALRSRMRQALAGVKDRRVVTFHEAFPYFAKEFDLQIVGVIEKEPGQEPTAEEIAGIIEIVRRQNVKVLFTEDQYPIRAAETIARETGAKIYAFDLVVTGPKNACPSSYEDAMERNLVMLKEALH
jgi:zinc transport system substrate-binding protein